MGRAELVLQEKVIDQDGDITELAIWKVPISARQLYDNHHPKGHHRHIEGAEEPYEFIDVDKLVSDFEADVRRMKGKRG